MKGEEEMHMRVSIDNVQNIKKKSIVCGIRTKSFYFTKHGLIHPKHHQ